MITTEQLKIVEQALNKASNHQSIDDIEYGEPVHCIYCTKEEEEEHNHDCLIGLAAKIIEHELKERENISKSYQRGIKP